MIDADEARNKPGHTTHYAKDAALNVREAALIAVSTVPIAIGVATGIVTGVSIFGSYWLARKAICAWRGKPCDYNSPFLWTQRVGADGEHIDVLKFRTMRDITSWGAIHIDGQSTDNDDRMIGGLGKLFRKSGLDESLQIFNIAKGEMTFHGSMRPKTVRDWLLAAGLDKNELPEAVARFEFAVKSDPKISLLKFMDGLLDEDKLSPEWVTKIRKVLSIKPSIIGWSQVDPSIDKTPEKAGATRQMIDRQISYMDNPRGKRKDMYLAAFRKVGSFGCDGRKRKSSRRPFGVPQRQIRSAAEPVQD